MPWLKPSYMRCIVKRCKGDTMVKDSRDFGDRIRRRRECVVCKNRFTTYEFMLVDKVQTENAPTPLIKPKPKGNR